MEEPLFQSIISWENIVAAYKDARKCKRTRMTVMAFEENREANLQRLQRELATLTYKTGEYHFFTVYEPKARDIASLPFRDRVAQHAIYRVINPVFDKTFIYDSYACRIGKGTQKAVNRVASFMNKKGYNWYLYGDISHFFASINPSILKVAIRRKIKEPSLLYLIDGVIDSTKKPGMPIGNLLSQLFANIYLHELDFYIVHHIKPHGFVRYMDDMILFFDNKLDAKAARENIEFFLRTELDLSLNKKTRIGILSKGLTFCGMVIRQHSIRRRRQTLQRVQKRAKLWVNGRITNEDILGSLGSAFGLCQDITSALFLNKILYRCLLHMLRP